MRRGDLEINEDPEFQRRTWTVERCGWALMALLVLAAVLGLFGGGPLSSATAGDGKFRVSYERFARLYSSTILRVHLPVGAGQTDVVRLSLDAGYLDAVSLRNVLPEPAVSETTPEGVTFTFRAGTRGNGAPVVAFEVEPSRPGLIGGEAQLEDGRRVSFRHLVYP